MQKLHSEDGPLGCRICKPSVVQLEIVQSNRVQERVQDPDIK